MSVLLIFVSMTSGADHGDNAESVADVRCIIVAMNVSEKLGSDRQSAAMVLALYYLGRLDGRGLEPTDIEDLITRETARMTSADLRSEAGRCGSEFTEKGHHLEKMAEHFAHPAKEQSTE